MSFLPLLVLSLAQLRPFIAVPLSSSPFYEVLNLELPAETTCRLDPQIMCFQGSVNISYDPSVMLSCRVLELVHTVHIIESYSKTKYVSIN